MRRILFSFIAFAFTATTFAQNEYVKLKHPKANESVVNTKADRIDPRIEPLDFAPGTSIVNAVSRKNANGLDEAVTMITQYDLQTNSALGNRIYAWPDGSVAAVATWGNASAPFPNRGTGYSFYNGTAWSPMPTARVEPFRSGWPGIAPLGTGGEALVSHGGSPFGVNFYTRATKGTGTWTANGLIPNPPGRDLTWPRLASSGENNSVLHAIGGWLNAYPIESEVYYNRSFDGGTTWQGWAFPPEVDLGFYMNSISTDDYVIATNGDNVAVLFVSAWYDLFFIKSTDNGDTWEKTVVWEHPYPSFNWNTTFTTDTLYAPDNSANIAIDNDGMVHVVWATTRVTHTAPGTSFSHFPLTDGIGYWNETMGQIPANPANPHKTLDPEYLNGLNLGILVGWMPDINGDGQVTYAGDYLSYRSLGISTMPAVAVDENGSIMIVYSTWDETRVSEGKNLRSVFATYKDGFTGIWYPAHENITSGIFHEDGEAYSVTAAQRGYDGTFYVMYSEDENIGLALDDDHGYVDNLIYVVQVDKRDFFESGLPVINTDEPTEITFTTAIVGGTVQNQGMDVVTERGIYWSLQPNPGEQSNKILAGTGTGTFTITLENLEQNTTYYVRAFATNAQGTALGKVVNFTTMQINCTSDWEPVSNLQYNMQLVAQILIDGQVSVNPDDVLGAFVGGECRGVASPQPEFNGLVFLTIGSDVTSGEEIEFRIWNSSDCSDCLGIPGFEFVNQSEIGTFFEPYQIRCGAVQHLTFGQGFTWFSVNVNPGSMTPTNLFTDLNPCYNDRIIGQTSFVLYTGSLWAGTLTQLSAEKMYRMRLCSTQSISIAGDAAPLTPINLNAGYTWLGYAPQECLLINEALANLLPAPAYNDRLIGQSSFALYTGTQWIGTLTTLCPGEGYVIRLANGSSLNWPVPVPTPVAAFTADITEGAAPLTVNFTDQSNNSPSIWLWDFGDGHTSTQQNPSHTYQNIGNYSVQLTVSNGYGSSDTETKIGYITVVERPIWPLGTVHCTGTPTAIVDVTNPATGKTWMDRNLGASQAATSSTDTQAYGDLYQWGRFADGHQCRNSGTTSTLSSSDTPGHSNFITVNSGNYDWRSSQNNNLWQGINGINNPCPSGYRLPTEAEFNEEIQSWNSNNATGAFESLLKLPLAGTRACSNGSLFDMGNRGGSWSSNIVNSLSRGLGFGNWDANVYNGSRGDGVPVRCIND